MTSILIGTRSRCTDGIDAGEFRMARGPIGCLALCITAVSAFADPKIDSAIRVFRQTQADAGKLNTFLPVQ
jgi:hypothetical protein